ncbi:MAG: hypothetical protein ACO3CD_04580 [Candidatus Nanopelagicaceae bacterium]|jgi:hypothetical protein
MEESKDNKPKKSSKYKDVVARMKAASARQKRQAKIDKLSNKDDLWKNLT